MYHSVRTGKKPASRKNKCEYPTIHIPILVFAKDVSIKVVLSHMHLHDNRLNVDMCSLKYSLYDEF